MLVDEGLELLEEGEARRLLYHSRVGRVGLTVGGLPAILPVNYVMLDESIVFRSSPGSKLSAAAGGDVLAFEVDDFDLAERTGWSVLALGRSEVVHDLAVTLRVVAAGLEPWAPGRRHHLVRIQPELVTGRRIVPEPPGLAASVSASVTRLVRGA